MNILLVNCKPRQCGVYQFGLNLWRCLNSVEGAHKVIYLETDTPDRFNEGYFYGADLVIWNHHNVTSPWLTSNITDKIPSALIVHDSRFPWPKVGYIHFDPDYLSTHRDLKMGRPILPPLDWTPAVIPNSIGSFGFGFDNKGFDDLILRANEEYETATVRLNIPSNNGVDADGLNAKITAERCFGLAKKGVTCYITHEWFDDEQMLTWLGQNEINAFFYKNNDSKGLASTVDWAIRARRPFAVSNLQMFRHVHDVISPTDSLKEIIKKGIAPLQHIYDNWTPKELHKDLEVIVPKVLEFYA